MCMCVKVDRDEKIYTVEKLKHLKHEAEAEAGQQLGIRKSSVLRKHTQVLTVYCSCLCI